MTSSWPIGGSPDHQAWNYPLGQAIAGRRSRRFALGMEIPSGPLAFRSNHSPLPLSEEEESVLLAAATGVTGWSSGIPYTIATPHGYPSYSQRLSGRAFPTGAGVGTPELFYTNDRGTYLVKTRDLAPLAEDGCTSTHDMRTIAGQVQRATIRLSDHRLEVPREPPHIQEHNLWNANFPGSTLFLPVTDLSEHFFSSLTMRLLNGYLVYDDWAKRPAGDLAPFVRSGLISEDKRAYLSLLEQNLIVTGTSAITALCHNVMLTMQAMGLGGWMYTGINAQSVMGAQAEKGIPGLGFRFMRDLRWTVPDPVGLDGHYQALCPPYYPDMHAAAREVARRKFGPGGTYDPATPGPFFDNRRVKASVVRHTDEFVACLGTVAQYIYDTYGKFPGTVPTMLMGLYVQVQHIDTEFYDTHFGPGMYLETHRQHMARWHNAARKEVTPWLPSVGT